MGDAIGAGINLNGIYSLLYARYGDLRWWPAKTPFEVMVGAVLTQNTAWGNVEKAIANFRAGPTPQFIEMAGMEELANIIRPAGFFNQKAACLKSLTEWYKNYGYSVEKARARPLATLRGELLGVKGIGKETADSILLYAFGLPTFVIDAYTLRLTQRLAGLAKPLAYDAAQRLFSNAVDENLYNNAHALIVMNAKGHCAAKPKCEGCPLSGICRHCQPVEGDPKMGVHRWGMF